MPEYLALQHFHNQTGGEEVEPEPVDAGDMAAMALRMERAGIARVH